jgi:Tol biopolymer transport system component/serine/threonine protein kinase
MTPERWARIDQLLDEAMALPVAERAAWLEQTCADDDELRHEVESLLAAHQQAETNFMQAPALALAAQQLAASGHPSLTGKTLDHYQVLSRLGAGGMGEVYLARDTRLNRQVVLKLLPAQYTQDAARIRRFEREARAASALNHPNIITIHDIGQSGDQHFMATEYVEGRTLREMLAQGCLPAREALDIATQICAALAAAHAAGIIHRDIKPENVMLRRDGYVKVLDFGLAKLTERRRDTETQRQRDTADSLRLSVSPSLLLTAPGVVLGTVKYMSPEQALAQDVDARSDIFSLGVTLYELLTSVPPFKGESIASTLDAIIHHQPVPLTQARPDLHPELERIVTRALEKDRELRYQSADDLRAVLKRAQKMLDSQATGEVAHRTTAESQVVRIASKRKPLVWLAAALALVAVAGFVWWRSRSSTEDRMADWAEAKFEELTEFAGTKTYPTLSADGQYIVYARRVNGQFDLFRQRVGGSNLQNLTPNHPGEDSDPSFSPDGNLIAFRAERAPNDGVYVIGATGENERLVASDGFNPSWSPEGTEIIYSTQRGSNVFQRVGIGGEIWAVNWQSGARRRIAAGPDAVQPRWSPNGHRIAYWGLRNASQRDIFTIPATGGEPVSVTDDAAEDFSPTWSHDGRWLYFSSNRSGRLSLWRVRIDERTGQPQGAPQPLSVPSPYSVFLTVSRDGKRMAYASRLVRTNIRRVPFDPVTGAVTGAPEWVTQLTRRATNHDISPDGKQVAFFSFGDPQFDIFVASIGGAETRQLTNDRFRDRAPRWSSDGQRLAFFSDRSGKFEIWTMTTDGGNLKQLTFSAPSQPGFLDPAWSPDGTRMLFSLRGGGESFLMDLRRSFQEQTLFVFPPLPNGKKFTAYNWSPNGEMIAGMEAQPDGNKPGLIVYDLQTQKYERISNQGDSPYWLPDNRRLLCFHNHEIYLIDRSAKTVRRLLAHDTEDTLENPTLSRDGRWLYYGVNNNEESVYLITLK